MLYSMLGVVGNGDDVHKSRQKMAGTALAVLIATGQPANGSKACVVMWSPFPSLGLISFSTVPC